MRSKLAGTAALIALIAGAALALPAGAAAASRLAIYVPRLEAGCMFITAPANETVTLKWKNAMGAVKETTSIPTGTAGDPLYCSPSNVVRVGDKLKLTDASGSHTLTVPNLTAQINRVTDTFSGHGPSTTTLRIECGGSPFGQFEPCQYTKNVTTTGSGAWSKHVPFDLFGGFTMSIRWHNAFGDIVYRWATTPHFVVTLGQSNVSGFTQADGQATVTLLDSSSSAKGSATATADSTGAFSGQLRDNHNDPVNVAAGDHVSSNVASDAAFVFPTISASANAANDHVLGQCELNGTYAGVFVQVYRAGQLLGAAHVGESDGSFNANFGRSSPTSQKVNIKPGDKVVVNCQQGENDYAAKVITA